MNNEKPNSPLRKKFTIADIADRANVSKSTVSRVINGSTPVNQEKREAVLAAMKETGFEPNFFAQSLASGQSKTIGVLTQNTGSSNYDAISQGILLCLTQSPYSPIFADGQWKPDVGDAAVSTLLARKIDGLIVIGSALLQDELNRVSQILPTVVVGREIDTLENQCLYIDNEQAGYDATKHLIDLGHRRIAHITGTKGHQDSLRRLAGYRRALTEANIEIDEAIICQGQFSDGNSGAKAVEMLIEKGCEFTALFASNDLLAFGARLALYRKGLKVPEDISIIGFDDQEESAFCTPPLTTVKQPACEMGRAAAEVLLKLISGQEYQMPTPPAEIIVRESTQART